MNPNAAITVSADIDVGERLALVTVTDGLALPVTVRLPLASVFALAAAVCQVASQQHAAADAAAGGVASPHDVAERRRRLAITPA